MQHRFILALLVSALCADLHGQVVPGTPQTGSDYVTTLRKLLGGTISTNVTLGQSIKLYHVTSDVQIVNGATVTILPGTILKFAANTNLYVNPGATLNANGTSSQPIYFTSMKDDSVGPSLPPQVVRGVPAPGDWGELEFDGSSSQQAYGSLSHVVVRYGQRLVVRDSRPAVRDVTSTHMSAEGLFLDEPPEPWVLERLTLTHNERNLRLSEVPEGVTIRDSVLRHGKYRAISAFNSAARLENNVIEHNDGAIYADGESPLVLRYNSISNNRTAEGESLGIDASCCATVDARFNWWGSTTGPEVEGQSNSGGGGQVGDYTLYGGWLGEEWTRNYKLGDHPWTIKAGVGVDVATGNFFLSEDDVSIDTVGFPLEISRTYNSLLADEVSSEMGAGWVWSYGTKIREVDHHGVLWQRDDGTLTYFKRNADDSFTGEEGIHDKLTWEPSSQTYRLRRKDQSVLVFAWDGKLSLQIDANGNTTVITRDGSRQVTRVTEPFGRTLTFEYSGSYISRITDPLGRSIVYERWDGLLEGVIKRDQYGNVYAQSSYRYDDGPWDMEDFDDADGNHLDLSNERTTHRVRTQRYNGMNSITFDYDEEDYRTRITDTRDFAHDFFYTGSNKVVRHEKEQPSGSFRVEGRWDYVSYLTSTHTDRDGTTTSTYDWAAGNLIKRIRPGNRTTRYAYDAFNNVLSERNANGNTTTFAYDSRQNLTAETDAAGNVTRHEYDSLGRKTATIDARGHRTTFAYGPFGYLRSVTNPLGQTTRYEYDVAGRKTSETDPLGNTTTWTYNARDQVLSVVDPLGNRTSYGYDLYGRKESTTDAEGRWTWFQYDDTFNALWKTIDTMGGEIVLTRDGYNGNVISVRDPNGQVTRFEYDDYNRRTAEIDPLGRRWTYEYTGTDRIASMIDGNGRQTTYAYDSSTNDLRTVYFADGRRVDYSYDGAGNKTSMIDWTGETRWVHDQLDRVVAVNKNGQETGYFHDAVGNLLHLQTENGKLVQYTYDAANRMKTVVDWLGRVTSYSYDAAGRIAGYTLPNGVNAGYTYDAAGRLKELVYRRGGSVFNGFFHQFDRVGNRRSVQRTSGIESYQYDPLYRLTEVTYSNGRVERFGYDQAGNRTWRYDSSWGFTNSYGYDAAGQLWGDESGACSYDGNGATTRCGDRQFGWDAQHHLAWAYMNWNSESFVYDGDGRRMERSHAGGTTRYVVDTVPKISRVLRETANGVTTHYVYGHDLLYSIEGSATHYHHADALGTVMTVTSNTGTTESQFSHDAFGQLGGNGLSSWSYAPRHGFTGEETDSTTLVYLRARYYNPWNGRFLSRDPFPIDAMDTQSVNRYVYSRNNPATLTDPTGEIPVLLATGLAGMGIGLLGQLTSDAIRGEFSGWRSYGAAAVGGFIEGVMPMGKTKLVRRVAKPLIAGGSAGVESLINQGHNFSGKQFTYDVLSGVGASYAEPLQVKGGRGSIASVQQGLLTKYERGSIRNVSWKSAGKIMFGQTVLNSPGWMWGGYFGSLWP